MRYSVLRKAGISGAAGGALLLLLGATVQTARAIPSPGATATPYPSPSQIQSFCAVKAPPGFEEVCIALFDGKPPVLNGQTRDQFCVAPFDSVPCKGLFYTEHLVENQKAAYQFARGLPPTQARVVINHGVPCHEDSEDRPHMHIVEYWYCNSNGVQSESYTFINGKLVSHFNADR